jgi:predicted oxidoreductase (fatty acid repression mutant protein)
MPEFSSQVRDEWDLPGTWQLQAQLVFGGVEGGQVKVSEVQRSRERTYLPVEERVRVFDS